MHEDVKFAGSGAEIAAPAAERAFDCPDAPVAVPMAPGIVQTVFVENMRMMAPGEEVDIVAAPCVQVLDGEREVEVKRERKTTIRLSTGGPIVVDIARTSAVAMRKKIFAPEWGKGPAASQPVRDGKHEPQLVKEV